MLFWHNYGPSFLQEFSLSVTILSLKNLSFNRNEKPVFDPIDLEINEGDLVHIKGANGSGKTTLLRILVGLLQPSSGSIKYQGVDLQACLYDYFSNITYVGHNSAVKNSLTVFENLCWMSGENKLVDSHINTLETFGLLNQKDSLCGELSAGQKRKLALTRILHNDSKIWFLDEPMNALDSQGVSILKKAMEKHKNNQGIVVFASHQDVMVSDVKKILIRNTIH